MEKLIGSYIKVTQEAKDRIVATDKCFYCDIITIRNGGNPLVTEIRGPRSGYDIRVNYNESSAEVVATPVSREDN